MHLKISSVKRWPFCPWADKLKGDVSQHQDHQDRYTGFAAYTLWFQYNTLIHSQWNPPNMGCPGISCEFRARFMYRHYSDVIMGMMASHITGTLMVCSAVCSGADQRKHQSSASMAFVMGIHRPPVNFPHKGPVTRKMFPFDDIIVSWRVDPSCAHNSDVTWT